MEEFLLRNYIILTHSVEAMAALTAVVLFKKYKHTTGSSFVYFLVYLTICDTLSEYTWYVYEDGPFSFLIGTLIEKNYWWSTLYWKIGAILFFAFYYLKIVRTSYFRKIIRLSSIGFLIFSITYILVNLDAFFKSFFPIISVLGAVIVFLCTVFYFIEILQNDSLLTFYNSLNFYISAAIFIWWLIITPIVFYDNYTAYEIGVYERDWEYIKLRRLIYISANIFMYSTFTFALIYCKPKNDFIETKN